MLRASDCKRVHPSGGRVLLLGQVPLGLYQLSAMIFIL
jgi:hypothetical protein